MPLVFTHVPKTAGSSFTESIKDVYGPQEILLALAGRKSLVDFLQAGGDPLSLKYIGAHVKLHDVDELFGIPPQDQRAVITVREPLERAISHFLYHRRHPKTSPLTGSSPSQFRFLTYFDHLRENSGADFRNLQCQYICPEATFESARRTLHRRYRLAATVDALDRFVACAAEMEGFSSNPAFRLQTVNVAPRATVDGDVEKGHRPEDVGQILTDRERRRFIEDNREDYRLYEFVAESCGGLFDNR